MVENLKTIIQDREKWCDKPSWWQPVTSQ